MGKCKYSGYDIGFDSKEGFTHPSGGYGRNAIIFGADLSSSTHANKKIRSILVLGKDLIQGIDGTTIYAVKLYSTNFTASNKKFCLSLHYNGQSIWSMVRKLLILKPKILKLCNIYCS